MRNSWFKCAMSVLVGFVALWGTVLAEDSPEIAGVVVDDSGQGVAGARFSVLTMDARRTWQFEVTAETVTDENGRFSLRGDKGVGLPNSFYAAHHPDYGLAWAMDMVVVIYGGDPADLRLVLPERGSVRGRVTDTEGNPVEGAVVSAGITLPEGVVHEAVRFFPPCEALLKAISSADGTFVLDGLPSNAWVMLRVSHPDYAVALEGTPEAMLGTPAGDISVGVDDVTVRLEPGATVEGEIILEQTGQPAEGAVLHAVPLIEDFATSSLLTPDKVETDPNGRYVLQGLTAGTHAIMVTHADGIAAPTMVEVAPGARIIGQDIALERGALISGRIIDAETAEPVCGVELTALREYVGAGRESLSVVVGSDGAFSLRQLPGQVLLTVNTRLGQRSKRELTLVAGEDETDLEILLADWRSPEAHAARRLAGKEAAELDVAEWVNSGPTTLAALRGRIVVLAFSDFEDATRAELVESLTQLREGHSTAALEIITVYASGTDADGLGEFFSDHAIAYQVAVDKPSASASYQGATFEKYRVKNLPAAFIIDAEGKVKYQDVPLAAVEEAVKQLLNEQ